VHSSRARQRVWLRGRSWTRSRFARIALCKAVLFLLARWSDLFYLVFVSDAQLQAAIDRRISDFSRDVCERVRLGEITDTEANELTNEFVDRMYSQGPWS
jgi:hypothetical protein